MSKHILFIHGAGEGAYEEDGKLVGSLRHALGSDYEINHPAMPNEGNPRYTDWKLRIEEEFAKMQKPVILVTHSFGGSVLAKFIDENKIGKLVAGVFLVSTPFWGGDGWHYEGGEEFELSDDFAARLPQEVPVFLYHCRDDEIVPYEHLSLYKKLLPQATVRHLDTGGHQWSDDLSPVVQDIKSLTL